MEGIWFRYIEYLDNTGGSIAFSHSIICAAFSFGNINYRSPSILHPGLGIDVPKVAKRTVPEARQSSYYDANELNFTHGVAPGDPYPNSVILWTRISPQLATEIRGARTTLTM